MPFQLSSLARVAIAVVRPEPGGPEMSIRCGPTSNRSMPIVATSGPPTPRGIHEGDGSG